MNKLEKEIVELHDFNKMLCEAIEGQKEIVSELKEMNFELRTELKAVHERCESYSKLVQAFTAMSPDSKTSGTIMTLKEIFGLDK